MKRTPKLFAVVAVILSFLIVSVSVVSAAGLSKTYTLDADFDEGNMNNVNYSTPDQLQLSQETEPFNFIWVAVSSRGTIVKIDTDTGAVLGEYWTHPSQSGGANPSRTTVDLNGNVWVANRGTNPGSVTHYASTVDTDRNGDGFITTSSGLGDILDWGDDDALLHTVNVSSTGTRHVSVDANNDVWVSGIGNRIFNLIDGDTGAIIRTEGPSSPAYGGYGGLIDANGVIWSTNSGAILRWDTANPLAGPNGQVLANPPNPPDPSANWSGFNLYYSYGLGIDSNGYVWNTSLYNNTIWKFAPTGEIVGTYSHGISASQYAQGCAADANGDIWVAHSLWGSSVGHILNDGTYVGTIPLDAGSGPTGIAVDANGKIWTTGNGNGRVYRIDPTAGPVGADGSTPVGAVDLTIDIGGALYNYSDMTGSTLTAAPNSGSWTVVHDSTAVGAEWGTVSWNSSEPDDSSITVTAASSADGITFGPPEAVNSGVDLTVANGQYLKVVVTFQRSTGGVTPVLYDLTITPVGGGPGPDPGEVEVGGDIYPTNKIALTTPWIALALILVGLSLIIWRRHSQAR